MVALNKPAVCPIVIGRAADLMALHTLIDRVKSGKEQQGRIALISGEAGIGKSRLVIEAKTYASDQGFLLFQGNCFPTDLSYPYAPILDLFRALLTNRSLLTLTSELKPFAHELLPLLPDLLPLFPDLAPASTLTALDPEQEKRRVFEALTQFFLAQAAKQPVLLIIEDLHWSDDTSLEFLHYLARRTTTQPFLLLLTYRNDEVRPGLSHWLAQLDRERLAQEVSLVRLTHSDVDAMLRAIFDLQRPLHPETLDAIYSLTEGNPFFIEEVLSSLIASGEIFYTQGNWERKPLSEWHIPRSVQDAVHQRTEQLSPAARELLSLAAVAGRRFDFTLLQQLMQRDEHQLLLLIKELIAAQLVVEESDELFAFRHALTRQAIYSELLARERKALHRTIAETMEQLHVSALDAHLADLAYHFYEAGAWEKALEYAQRAGEKAQILYAPYAAIDHFSRALHAASHLSEVPPSPLFRARGMAYEILGEFERARADYEAALEIARATNGHQAEWEALLRLGMLWTGRDYERSGEYYQHAFELAHTMADSSTLARSLNRIGNWHLNLARPGEALQHHQEALRIFQELRDERGIAETFDLLGMTSYLGGDLLQGTAYYEQAVALFRQLDDRQGLTSSLATRTLRGATYQTDTMVPAASLAQLVSDGEMALKIAREIGQRSAEAYALILLAFCLGPQGEYTRALEHAQRSLEIAEEIEHRQWITAAHCISGALYHDLLDFSTARQHLEQALALANETNSLHWIHCATGDLASTYILQKELGRAESILNIALNPDTPVQTLGQRLAETARAELALAQNNPTLALHIIDTLLASAANISSKRSIPRLSKLRAEALIKLHMPAEAETLLIAARDEASSQGIRSLLWRIHLALGKLYQGQRRHEEAENSFSAAQTLIEDLATSISDESLRDHFLSSALALIPRSRPLSARQTAKKASSGLTQREREVAVLIAQGKSNREIADQLVVSERTIETHVGNILFKLGFVARTQIAAWVVEKGLLNTP